jgi:prolyl-tRNA editing enzyme YbaK/EbsC (Cys-tRNA(Pro) deacylase)
MPGRSDFKSLVFQGKQSHQALLVATSGANRVNEKKIAGLISEPLSKADADFVRDKTGFTIGGVPPLAHAQPIRIFIDEDLLRYDEIWAAAGTPRALFKLTPQDLQKITDGQVVSVK